MGSHWLRTGAKFLVVLGWIVRYSLFSKKGVLMVFFGFVQRTLQVDDMSPKYPRPTGKWWFGCPDAGTSASKDKGNQSDFVSVHAADPPHGDDRDADLLDAGTVACCSSRSVLRPHSFLTLSLSLSLSITHWPAFLSLLIAKKKNRSKLRLWRVMSMENACHSNLRVCLKT